MIFGILGILRTRMSRNPFSYDGTVGLRHLHLHLGDTLFRFGVLLGIGSEILVIGKVK